MTKNSKNICLQYGKKSIKIDLSEGSPIPMDIWSPPTHSSEEKKCADVMALLNDWDHSFRAEDHIAIAINDKTRPVDYELLLTPLLQFLKGKNIPKERIVIIIGTGTHTPITTNDYKAFIPGVIVDNYRIMSHDCDAEDNLIDLGCTSRGTQIYINKAFMEADVRITLGNIEPHHFMGYSGGVKTAGIGLAGRKTIVQNHNLLLERNTEIGIYEENPMRQDLEEIGDAIKVTACLNAVMSSDKKIVDVVFGTPREVMQKAIPISREFCMVNIPKKYDLVIASAGGYPKDINLYQAQKAITNACRICKPGGSILLIAECQEGAGNDHYAAFMQGKKSFREVLDAFAEQPFAIGPHKAFLIARQGIQYQLYLYSDMCDELVKTLLFTPVHSMEEFWSMVSIEGKEIALLPYAGTTVPI